jgi:hypothetical protein
MPSVQYEYKFVTVIPRTADQSLNKLGEEGWEVCAMDFWPQNGFAVVLKRAKNAAPPPEEPTPAEPKRPA